MVNLTELTDLRAIEQVLHQVCHLFWHIPYSWFVLRRAVYVGCYGVVRTDPILFLNIWIHRPLRCMHGTGNCAVGNKTTTFCGYQLVFILVLISYYPNKYSQFTNKVYSISYVYDLLNINYVTFCPIKAEGSDFSFKICISLLNMLKYIKPSYCYCC